MKIFLGFWAGIILSGLAAMQAMAQTVPLDNPLGTADILLLIGRGASILMGFIGSLSLLFVVLGGYRLLASRGNAEEIKKGQQTLVWAVIGVILSLLSYVIISLVIRTLTGAR